MRKLVQDVVLPLNVLAWPGFPTARRWRRSGVRRLSAGSGIGKAVLNHTLGHGKGLSRRTAVPTRSTRGPLTNPDGEGNRCGAAATVTKVGYDTAS